MKIIVRPLLVVIGLSLISSCVKPLTHGTRTPVSKASPAISPIASPQGLPRDPETQRVAVDLVNRLDALRPGQANDVLRTLGQPQQPTDEAALRAVKQLILVSPDLAALNKIGEAMPPQ